MRYDLLYEIDPYIDLSPIKNSDGDMTGYGPYTAEQKNDSGNCVTSYDPYSAEQKNDSGNCVTSYDPYSAEQKNSTPKAKEKAVKNPENFYGQNAPRRTNVSPPATPMYTDNVEQSCHAMEHKDPSSPITISMDDLVHTVENILQQNKVKEAVPPTICFRCDCSKKMTYLQIINGEHFVGEAPFCDCKIETIEKVIFDPPLDFQNGYLLKLSKFNGIRSIFISEKDWNSRRLTGELQNRGINFYLSTKNICNVELLRRLLAHNTDNLVTYIIDPRSGIVQAEQKCQYILSDNNRLPLPFIPAATAALKDRERTPFGSIQNYFDTIGSKSPWTFSLLKTLFFWGTFFSVIRKNLLAPQNKFIFLHCQTSKDLAQVCEHFSIWREQDKERVNLSSSHKKFESFLNYAKDRILLINTDIPDISKRRQKNTALVKQYVCGGVSPNGYPADALIILAGIDLPFDIPPEDLLIFEIEESAIPCENSSHPIYASAFVHELIHLFNANSSCWKFLKRVAGAKDTQELIERLCLVSTEIVRQYFEIEFLKAETFEKGEKAFIKYLMEDSLFGDRCGNLMILVDQIEKLWRDQKISFKRNTDLFPPESLSKTLLFDKKSVFIPNQLLESLLPMMYQAPPTPIIFRKVLDAEDVLDKSSANQNGLQDRIRLKNGERPYGTAIKINSFLEYATDQLNDFIKGEII